LCVSSCLSHPSRSIISTSNTAFFLYPLIHIALLKPLSRLVYVLLTAFLLSFLSVRTCHDHWQQFLWWFLCCHEDYL
jgi:hypothetical protein